MNNFIAISMAILLLLLTGCTNEGTDKRRNDPNAAQQADSSEQTVQKINVKKRIGNESMYEDYDEIIAQEPIETVLEILDRTDWIDAEVDMVRPADYRFILHTHTSSSRAYALWVSPSHEKIELVIVGEGKYAQLAEEQSSILFAMITGMELNEAGKLYGT